MVTFGDNVNLKKSVNLTSCNFFSGHFQQRLNVNNRNKPSKYSDEVSAITVIVTHSHKISTDFELGAN